MNKTLIDCDGDCLNCEHYNTSDCPDRQIDCDGRCLNCEHYNTSDCPDRQ